MDRTIKSLISALLQFLLGFAIGAILTHYYFHIYAYEIIPNVFALKLGPSCSLDIHNPPAEFVRTIVLSCACTDQIRLCPLPIKQPWYENESDIYLEVGGLIPTKIDLLSAVP